MSTALRTTLLIIVVLLIPIVPFVVIGELPGERWLSAVDDHAFHFGLTGASLLAIDWRTGRRRSELISCGEMTMFYMLINRTRAGLTAEDFEKLGKLAQGFYDNIPAGVVLHNDWAANDGSRTFALLETDDPLLLEQIQAPFRPYVEMELVPVTAVTGWNP